MDHQPRAAERLPADRTPTGVLLVGPGPAGGVHHASYDGYAACTMDAPIADPVPIDQATVRRWCQRLACRRRWQPERRTPAAAPADVEHVCPACWVERAAGPGPCPSCGSAYAAAPEAALV